MKNNKYYTPEIEEFRVGFEYEELNLTSVYDDKWRFNIKKNIFTQEIWKPGYSNWNFLDNLKDGKIRVKYLDAQDIEELGFEKATTQIHFRKDDIEIVLWDIKDIHIRRVIDSSLTVNGVSRILVEPLYQGTILNKSELKWILTRIGVL